MKLEKREIIYINVRGTVFKLYKDTLNAFEDSVLACLDETSDNYDVSTGEYFFDRNPDYFNVILDAYCNNTIHIPRWVCGINFQKELEFWGLSSQYVSPCCWRALYSAEEDFETVSTLEKYYKGNTGIELMVGNKISLKNRIWLFLNEPHYSVYAKIWAVFISAVIVTSVMMSAIETIPEVYTETFTDAEARFVKKMLTTLSWKNITEMSMYFEKKPSSAIKYIDCFCFIILTIEMILCIILCQCRLSLIKNWFHISEMVCTLSFWYCFIVDMFLKHIDSTAFVRVYIVMRYFSGFKIVRLLRVANNIPALKLMGLTIAKAYKQIGVLILLLFILSSFFGFIIFISEFPQNTENVFSAMYWALITLTTVGYGDVTPDSFKGRVIASACAVCGILMIAIPIGIVASDYQKYYDHHNYAVKYLTEHTDVLKNDKGKLPEKFRGLHRNDSMFKFTKDTSAEI